MERWVQARYEVEQRGVEGGAGYHLGCMMWGAASVQEAGESVDRLSELSCRTVHQSRLHSVACMLA